MVFPVCVLSETVSECADSPREAGAAQLSEDMSGDAPHPVQRQACPRTCSHQGGHDDPGTDGEAAYWRGRR